MKQKLSPFFISGAAVLLLCTAHPALGQRADTPITLSCNDGHSVAATVDQAALFGMQTAVQALIAHPTGLTCTITPAATTSAATTSAATTSAAATPATTPVASWTVYDYNSSGQIVPRTSAASMPATITAGTVSFPFKLNTYTALLTTNDSKLTGNLSGKTLSTTISVSGGTGTFQDQFSGGCIPDNKTVRFYFASPNASGTTGAGTVGFYTKFWWSNPVSVILSTDPQPAVAIAQLVDTPHAWSDWNGKFNDDSPQVMAAFQSAIRNVQTVGLSFGGGCFFENGVTTSDGGGIFNSTFTSF